jgi:hypothetical protein
MDALYARHAALREKYGALLLADPHQFDADAGHAEKLAAVFNRAADLRPDATAAYTAGSQYAAAIGELEAAWQPFADTARRRGLLPLAEDDPHN